MMEALKEWVEIRERIFAFDGIPPIEMWKALADAEHKLMAEGRAAVKGWSQAQQIAFDMTRKKHT